MTLSLLVAALAAAAPLSPLPVPTPHFSPAMTITAAPPSAVQGLRFSLVMPNRPALDAFIAEQKNSASPLYRHWLTPEGFGERFGQSAGSYQRFVDLFEEAGMKVRTFHNRLYLEAVGTVAQMEKLVGVKFVDVAGEGQAFRSFRGTPRLPPGLASLVQSVSGFDTRPRFHHLLYANGEGTSTMGPQDLRRFYDIESLHSQGYGGQLSSVVLVGELAVPADSVDLADVQYFYSAVSDSPATPVLISLPLDASGLSNEQYLNIELNMDMELPTVAAPLMKTVTMVLAPQDNLIVGAYNYINENLPDATAVSLSFSGCEPALLMGGGAGDAYSTSDVVAQGVSEGIAYFTGSGDTGADDCEADGLPVASASVGFPADVPYMTTMGGLQFAETPSFDANSALSAYAAEAVWNEASQAGGGGGVSVIFDRAWYQYAPGTTTDGGRLVPDLALLATSSPGIAIVDQAPGLIDGDGDGTSDASPMGAGMFALINDFIGGCRLGSPDPELYALGRWQYGDGGISVFHDTTVGNNSLYGVSGFSAGPGFDEASGLGSLDVAHLAAAWPLCPLAPDVDGGPRVDAGFVPYPDGGALPWVVGYAEDAGLRSAYSPCQAIACDGGPAIDTSCLLIPEGPAQCYQDCSPGGAAVCSQGNFCYTVDAGEGVCTEGCTDNAGCVGSDAGSICVACGNFCSGPANDAGVDGAACTTNADCPFGANCATANYGFPNGFCAAGCPSACGCSAGTACDEIVSNEESLSLCAPTCSVRAAGPCRLGYTCFPQNSSDDGFCMPACTTQNQICNAYAPAGSVCNSVNGGICIPPGVTPPTPTSSTSSSSGSVSASSAASSASGSSTGSSRASVSASGSSGTSSTAAAAGTTSSTSGSASATSSTSTSSGGSTPITTSGASTGSTGASSSAKSSGGCSCDAGARPDVLGSLMLASLLAGSRRRRSPR